MLPVPTRGRVQAPPGTACAHCKMVPTGGVFDGYIQTGVARADYFCSPACFQAGINASNAAALIPPAVLPPAVPVAAAGDGICDFCGRVGLAVFRWSGRLDICQECREATGDR
jgi:hypothetical protein